MIEQFRRRLTRRNFLLAGIRLTPYAGAAFLGFAAHDHIDPPKNMDSRVINTAPPKEKTTEELLQEILNLPPFIKPYIGNSERVRKENEYVGRVSKNPTLVDIDKGFWVLSHQPARAELLELRYTLRQSGKEKKLVKISQDMIDWAAKWKIHPEILGIALDNYEREKKIIAKLNQDGKLSNRYKLKEPDDGMINIGGLAMLITMETGPIDFRGESFGFTNIGQDMAVNQISGEDAPKDKAALDRLPEIFFKTTGLKLNPNYVPGSIKGEHDDSGGAIGPQFRPEKAEEIEALVQNETGEVLNVFDLNNATLMIWTFLARDEYVGKDSLGNDLYRVGYRKDEADVRNAIIKWFGAYGTAAQKTEAAAYDFFDNFLKPKPSATP